MEILVFILVLAMLPMGLYLDYRYNFQFVDWMNGACSNPFVKANKQSSKLNDKDATIAELKERIAVLEKVVTEPAYELNKKLNQL
jgi:uncharacterized small protein (DUF1192 family)